MFSTHKKICHHLNIKGTEEKDKEVKAERDAHSVSENYGQVPLKVGKPLQQILEQKSDTGETTGQIAMTEDNGWKETASCNVFYEINERKF